MNNFANIISTLKIYIYKYFVNIASVQLSCVQLFETLQHARSPCPIPTLWVYPNSCPLSQWCHRTISSSIVPFSSCLQSFLASGSFPMNQFFALGSQNIGVSAYHQSFQWMYIQDWFPLGWTGWISLQSKVLASDSSTTIQKHEFFDMLLSL